MMSGLGGMDAAPGAPGGMPGMPGGMPGMPGGMPGMPGGANFMEMMSDPRFMAMAQNMVMSNPQLRAMYVRQPLTISLN